MPKQSSLSDDQRVAQHQQHARVLRARLAAYSLHAKVADPSAHTAPARQAFRDRFAKQVDPDGILDPAERARRAEHARKAYYLGLALRSAAARKKVTASKRKAHGGMTRRPATGRAEQSRPLRGRLRAQVDPDRSMPSDEQDRLASEATSNFYRDLAAESVAARRGRRAAS